MSMSLRDQLIQAGLVTEKQARKAAAQGKRPRGRHQAQRPSETQLAASKAQQAKSARDEALNRRRQEKAEAKARYAQIRQLVQQHGLPPIESDEYFNFVHRGKLRRIPVDGARREQLIQGKLDIVRCDGRFSVVPEEVAARIREREQRAVVARRSEPAEPAGDDDPYKDFVVPDDLIW